MSKSRSTVETGAIRDPATHPTATASAGLARAVHSTTNQQQQQHERARIRSRIKLSGNNWAPEQQEVYTTTEIVKSRHGGTKTRTVEHDAKTGIRLTPYATASESGDESDSEGSIADYDRTTAATVATSSPATVIRRRSSSDGDTKKTTTDNPEPISTAGTGERSPDRTEEAQMEENKQLAQYTEDDDDVSQSADCGADEDEESEDEGDDEEGDQREYGEEDEEEVDNEEDTARGEAIWGNANAAAAATRACQGNVNNGINHQVEVQGLELDDNEDAEEYYDDEHDEDDEGNESDATAYSHDQEDSDNDIDDAIREEMEDFCAHFKDIEKRFRLISKIGEGTFSSVYKAEDLLYDRYDNDWDWESQDEAYEDSLPPNKRRKFNGHTDSQLYQRRRPKYVAIKKIYVTSSPQRIMNELELLHALKGSRDVVPLITAFRHLDQVVAILPYFRHVDFRQYFRTMSIPAMRLYFRSLFSALCHVHEQKIIHRDIKPTNFLYDISKGRGVLVDFGLAEREGADSSYCPCQNPGMDRERKEYRNALINSTTVSTGYIKNDTRPSRRANRAGTRGFRAPEVLFKCTSQTTKIDIWSAGVILLTMLTKRFPFFNSADDVDATVEIATIFGRVRMRACALLHGAVFETTLPTIGERGFSLEKIVLWSTNRIGGGSDKDDKQKQQEREKEREREAQREKEREKVRIKQGMSQREREKEREKDRERAREAERQRERKLRDQLLPEDEKVACEFLARCLELDPEKRISAVEALQHPFFTEEEEEEGEDEQTEKVQD
ncbi:kinase-like domain-containing protein [Kalaharituber pfeilii]|nr:kinase-like domain-containing protein [Kalaharituber pfeilii]